MKSDIEIANSASLAPIGEVAARVGLDANRLDAYGKYKAKVPADVRGELASRPDGRLILVTAISPTTAGEGKTTTCIGLADAFWKTGRRAVVALREPSLGPCFGMKGGAAGGGFAQVVPMEDINLHFTGDFHAVTTANNLLAALIDNHIQQGNELGIDPRRITWRRVLDVNDRSLRNIVTGLGGKADGVPREAGFDITAASEMMAILCLSADLEDLKRRLGAIVVGYNVSGSPVRVADLKVTGALALLFKDAINPNLVQTLEGTPALIHGGPFANIAHGCNSVIATRLALKLADVVVTEAGFGADLGAEKFFDIKCRFAGVRPAAAVVVASVRALKLHGGMPARSLGGVDMDALDAGIPNLVKHVENVRMFGVPVVVAINSFPTDTPEELDFVRAKCREIGVDAALSEVWAHGGDGGVELARKVWQASSGPVDFRFLYDVESSIPEKIDAIARGMYGADGVEFSDAAKKSIRDLESAGLDRVPVCVAKTQYSLTDDPSRVGRPTGFRITVREIRLSAGAGFVVALTGNIMTMPGLPRHPAAENMDISGDGTISGLF